MELKFTQSKFWRQFGDCCMFLEVLEVLDDTGETAELKVAWKKQLDKGFKHLAVENIKVRPRDYPRWVSYFPRGDDLSGV
jgi:hypothetical protein